MNNNHRKLVQNIILVLMTFCGTPIHAQYSISGPIGASIGETKTYSVVGNNIFQTSWHVGSQGSIQGSTNPNAKTIQVQWNSTGSSYVSVDFVDYYYNSYFVNYYVSVTQPALSAPGNPTISSNGCGQATLSRSGSPPSGQVIWYWQGKSSSGTSTTKGSGSTFTINEGTGTYYIRARNSSGVWSSSSGSRYVSLVNLMAGSISGTQTICYNGDPSTLGSSSGAGGISGSYSYQWQYSTNGSSGWTNIGGATGSTYNPPNGLTVSRWFRRRATCAAQTEYTNTVKVTVNPNLSAGSIGGTQTICNGENPSVLTNSSSASGGNGSYSYQWQYSDNGSSGWTNISGASLTSYDSPGGLPQSRWYRRQAISCGQTKYTANVKVTVTQGPIFYADTDGDGYGDPGNTINACSQPLGYVSNSSDYDDNTVMITNLAPQTFYSDEDGDGFGTSGPTLLASFMPLGYAGNTLDQCPIEPGTNNGCSNIIVQPSDENYVHTHFFQDEAANESIESITYYDGLGRPSQQVSVQGFGTVTTASSPNTPDGWTMDWTEGSGGTPFFNRNGEDSENERIYGPNPFGETDLIWRCGNKPDNSSDGGWNTDYFNVDKTKTYRYMVWVRRDQSNNGITYHGTQNVDDLGGGANSNPYFWYGDPPQLGQWYLLVGIVHPYGYNGGDTGVSGVYDMQGNRVIDAVEFKWRSDTTTSRFRSYLYYCTDVNVRQYFYRPILEVVDGNETPLQEIFDQDEPNDIVTHIGYDAYGRQDKDWLPYVDSIGTKGSFRIADQEAATEDYYKVKFPTEIDPTSPNPFSQIEFEPSPLNRVMKQAAPGDDWALGSGHEIEFGYLVNTHNPFNPTDTTKDNVRLYKVALSFANLTYTPSLVDNGFYYPQGDLYKAVTKDENHDGTSTKAHTTEEFKDKQGRVVLKRTYGNSIVNGSLLANAPHDTYYVYDDYGNLAYVVPPKVDTSNGISLTELDELCYQYVYDHRSRLVKKKIPSKGWEYIVYNKLDEPVLIQDAMMRMENNTDLTMNRWLFTKYDAFGRVAYTGLIENNGTRGYLVGEMESAQYQFDSQMDSPIVLDGIDLYYTNDAKPNNVIELKTVNYYDDYTFDLAGGTSPGTVYGKTVAIDAKGLSTGSKVRVLGTNDWITTVTYYDDKGRPIYVYSKNDYLNTTDVVMTELDFVGRVKGSTTTHKRTGDADIVTLDSFAYDHMGRLLKQEQSIDNVTPEVLTGNNYDDLGQLVSKGVGGTLGQSRLQTVDYTYNVRGWLRQINDPANLGIDLFGFEINYNTANHNGAPLFNGNIAETEWRTANTDDTLKWYSYTYDPLNRITSAIDNTGKFNLTNVTYDKNGNIQKLKREGWTSSSPSLVNNTGLGTMDDLNYYYNSGNKLMKVEDMASIDGFGFKDDASNTNPDSVDDYTYDADGNMTSDANKGISAIEYNHLNLPTKITIDGNGNVGNIVYIYDAMGAKLKKITTNTATSSVTEIDYAGNYIYENNRLQFFNHAEGYVEPKNPNDLSQGFDYIYQYKDHQGNIRLSYKNIGSSTNPNLEIQEENNYYPFGLEHKGYNNVVNGAEHKWKYQGKEHEEELGLNTYDFGARNYMPDLGRWTSIDPLADGFAEYSPYNSMLNNPIMFIDPDGRAAFSPIYGTDGGFLGTDDQGLQGKAIVMDKKDFKQGMSHEKALTKSKGAEGLSSKEAGSKLVSHYNGLKDRPDYDGFVTVTEGVEWAKNNVGALDNPSPDNMLYIDSSKLDFGDVNTSNFQNLNEKTPINLFSKNNLLNSGLNSKLRATVYALGRVNMKLTDRLWGKAQVVNDYNQSSGRATDYDWNKGGSLMRRAFINAERARTGLNDTHGFRAYYYGTATIKVAPGRGITPPPVN